MICGLVIAADPIWTVVTEPNSIDSVLFAALGIVTGAWFVGWGLRGGPVDSGLANDITGGVDGGSDSHGRTVRAA